MALSDQRNGYSASPPPGEEDETFVAKGMGQIKKGDWVLAYDPESGRTKVDKVAAVQRVRPQEHFFVVNGKFRLMPCHQVLCNGEWVEVNDQLKKGDTLVDSAGESLKIETIKEIAAQAPAVVLELNPYTAYVANGVVVRGSGPGRRHRRERAR